jgi:protein translocase SecG subunit
MQELATILPWIQIILSILLVATIMIQRSEAGLGSAFGGGGGAMGNPFRVKRGLEKKLFFTTIILAILFVMSTLLALFIS